MAPTAALLREKFKTARFGCHQPGIRQNVTGGLGSFVMRVRGTDDIAATHRGKFTLDISMVQQ